MTVVDPRLAEATAEANTADPRYGVFLRPSPVFARLIAEAFHVMERQYGLREAASYPPHVTLVGSVALDAPESDLIDTLDAVLSARSAMTVRNLGLRQRPGDGIGYALAGMGDGSDPLRALGGELITALAPLRVFPPSDWDVVQRRRDAPERFHPHLTLAGRELEGADALRQEVHEFLVGAGFDGPASFHGDTVTLYRLTADAWTPDYWQSLTWDVVRSWRLS
ncbi:2'-5' RNA ligase family protein [Microbacterium gorillae]|uniref:2'-5' RNA ligase family protein n=1 Tax=Microbacterium gorillae TaxID=1231063 RepID=UPI00058FB700|nr:2'-5' RNA ligase family protein [Microbacterium gorillae]